MYRLFVYGFLLSVATALSQTALLTTSIPNPPPCDGAEIGAATLCVTRGTETTLIRVTGPALPVSVETLVISTPPHQWLKVALPDGEPATKIIGTPPFEFTVSQDLDAAAQIKAGAHLGYVQLSNTETAQRVRIPVRLSVPGESLTALPDIVELTAPAGRTARKEVRMDDLSRPDKKHEILLSPYTTDGGDWLSGSLNAGLSPCTTSPFPCDLAVEAKAPATPGDYEGALAVSSDNRALYIRVKLRVTPAPPPEVTADPRLPAASAVFGSTSRIALPVKVTSPGENVPFRVVTQAPWVSHILSSQTLPATINFSFNPTDLEPGIYTDLATVREAGTDRALLAIPITFYIVVPEYISHLADGANWKTKLYVVNLGAQDASFALQFRQTPGQTGQPRPSQDLALEFTGRTRATSLIEEVVPALGVRVYETAGTSRTLQQGWAEFRPSGAVASFAVLQRTSASGGALPALDVFTPLTNSIDDRAIVPFDHTEDATTEVMLANPSDASMTIAVTVRNTNGSDARAARSISLSRRGHAVVSLNDEGAMLGKTAGLRGTVEFAFPAGKLVLTAMRRKGSGITRTPVFGAPSIFPGRGIPYLASGGGWTTSMHLFNSADRDQTGTLQFWQKTAGDELPLWFANEELKRPSVSQSVPRREAVSLAIADRETAASTGWVETGFPPTVSGYGRLRQTRTGFAPSTATYEAMIPALRGFPGKMMLAFDNTGDLPTTVVISSIHDEPAAVQIVLYDERGRFRLGTESVQLGPYGQTRLRLEEKFAEDLVLGKRGLIELSTPTAKLMGVAIRGETPAIVFPPIAR